MVNFEGKVLASSNPYFQAFSLKSLSIPSAHSIKIKSSTILFILLTLKSSKYEQFISGRWIRYNNIKN
jgi:hypothetical protein